MAIVTQLMDVQFPLVRLQKPSQNMYNLARDIMDKAEDFENYPCSFYTSFGSPELSLLLPINFLNRVNPRLAIPYGAQLNLTWILDSYLKMEDEPNLVLEKFRSRPVFERMAFQSAVYSYWNIYGIDQIRFQKKTNRKEEHPVFFNIDLSKFIRILDSII